MSQTVQLIALDDEEITALVDAVQRVEGLDALPLAERVAKRLQFGEVYNDELDEYVCLRVRKTQIDTARKKLDARLSVLEAQLLDDFGQRGVTGMRHAATGKLVSITRKVWARVARTGEQATADEKQRACAALKAAGLGDYVEESFNVQSLSAYFRELAAQHDEMQRTLPESERTPLDVAELLPEPCRGAIELTDQPTLSVRS